MHEGEKDAYRKYPLERITDPFLKKASEVDLHRKSDTEKLIKESVCGQNGETPPRVCGKKPQREEDNERCQDARQTVIDGKAEVDPTLNKKRDGEEEKGDRVF